MLTDVHAETTYATKTVLNFQSNTYGNGIWLVHFMGAAQQFRIHVFALPHTLIDRLVFSKQRA